MRNVFMLSFFVVSMCTVSHADTPGTAAGRGTIERFIPGDESGNTEPVAFSPRFSFAYREGAGEKAFTWIVLTEKQPPVSELMSGQDSTDSRRGWCEREKASFVAVKLDSKMAVDLFFLCPGNGQNNMEMLSTANGLDSVVVSFESKSATRLKGSLKGGQGSCPDDAGVNRYCTQTSDYTFDAPIVSK